MGSGNSKVGIVGAEVMARDDEDSPSSVAEVAGVALELDAPAR